MNNEEGFEIERAQKIRGKYTYEPLSLVATDIKLYTDNSVDVGTYKYRIRAVNDNYSEYTNEILVTTEEITTPPLPDPETLYAPTDLNAQISGTEVTLTWNNNNAEETFFLVERGIKIIGEIIYDQGIESTNTPEYIETLEPGTYYYRVQASDGTDVSAYSNVVTVKIK